MRAFITYARSKFAVDKRLILIYVVVYFAAGWIMNIIGTELEIAKFTYWWQIITCYILYMIPVSLLLRGLPFHMQYAYGLVAMAILEFSGYALQTSYAYPDNIVDELFNIRNFGLGMALFFTLYFPLGNMLVTWIYRTFMPGNPIYAFR